MTKRIPLTKGQFTIVDDEDYEFLSQWDWFAHAGRNSYYAYRGVGESHVIMHRVILNVTDKDLVVDHIDGDGLNNQKSNLRTCTKNENTRNSVKRKDNTSGYKGVSWHKQSRKWVVNIQHNNQCWSKSFSNIIEAARAYDEKARELFGEFARLNFPTKG